METLDRDVRLAVYRRFVDDGRPPSVADVAGAVGVGAEEVEAAFDRLEASRVLVFQPGTRDIWMANPLCAVPTGFRVRAARGEWWGTCVWDALGIPAMLGEDAVVSTSCPDCDEPFELRVEGGRLRPVEGVAHFAVPARRWWEDIGFT
jgi:hypothetical protein